MKTFLPKHLTPPIDRIRKVQLLEDPQPLLVVVFLPEEPELVKECYDAIRQVLKEADAKKEKNEQRRNIKHSSKKSK
jgi:hypothetical protein